MLESGLASAKAVRKIKYWMISIGRTRESEVARLSECSACANQMTSGAAISALVFLHLDSREAAFRFDRSFREIFK